MFVDVFRYLRNLQTALQNGCTCLHSHQQWARVSFSQQPHKHGFFFLTWMVAILTGVSWTVRKLIVVLIYMSSVARDPKHLLMFPLAIWISSREKRLFMSFDHVVIGLLVFCCCCWVSWVLPRSWILILYLMHSFQTFSSILLLCLQYSRVFF